VNNPISNTEKQFYLDLEKKVYNILWDTPMAGTNYRGRIEFARIARTKQIISLVKRKLRLSGE
jgi:hypothetical protein